MTNTDPVDLGIIIVSYNVSSFLEECLKSINEKLKGLCYKVIVVDNDSHDNSASMVETKFPDCQLIKTGKNIGFGRAVNIGASAIRADNYLVLNPDTIITNNIIAEMVKHLKQNPSAGIVGCRMLTEEGKIQPSVYKSPSLAVTVMGLLQVKRLLNSKVLAAVFKYCAGIIGLNDYVSPEQNLNHWRKVQSVPGSCFLIRGWLFRQLKGYDEHFFLYFEDADLFFRVRTDKCFELHLLPNTGIVHLVGKSFEQEFFDISPRKYWSMLYYFWKNNRFWEYYVIRVVLLVTALMKMLFSTDRNYRNDCKRVVKMALLGWTSFDPFPA